MEFVEALQEFLFHQGFQKIKYDSKILWGKDTGDKLSLLEVVPPLLPGQPRIGLKQREEEMLDIERQIMLKYRKKVEHLLLILNKGEADFEERKEAEKYPDIWFFDIKAGQLYIYEYQKSQYCGLESSLEPFSQKFLQQKVTEERTELQRMLTPVNTILVFVNVSGIYDLEFFGVVPQMQNLWRAHGAMDWMDVVEKHQYYRLFTSMFLHFGADHLLQNMLFY